MHRSKVLHFIHSLESGGAERQLNILVSHLGRDSVDTAVFCVNPCGVKSARFPVELRVSGVKASISLQYLKNVWAVMSDIRPNVVHVWLPASVTIPAMIIARLKGAKVIFSYRNKMAFHRLLSYFEFITATICANKVVSNRSVEDSHFLFRWLFNKKNGEIVHNAVVIPEVYNDASNLAHRDFYQFIFVGRLTAQKNVLRLILALSTVDLSKEWRLDIYGVGEDEGIVRTLISDLNLNGKIFLRGFSRDIYDVMRESDALLFPSLYEGMPNALIEALAVGLPVVASRIPGNLMVIGDEEIVFWCDPHNEKSIADALLSFDSASLGSKNNRVEAGKLLANSYTVSSMVERYKSIYSRIVRIN